jgi:N-methylhydantoinase A
VSAALASDFEAAHQRLWNFVSAGKPVVVANLRLQIVTPTGWRGGVKETASATHAASIASRAVYFDGDVHALPVFRRGAIPVGARIDGPAVIEEHSSCAVLKSSQSAVVDADLNLVIELAA